MQAPEVSAMKVRLLFPMSDETAKARSSDTASHAMPLTENCAAKLTARKFNT